MHATLVASLAVAAAAAPLIERQAATPPSGVSDATILNYALSLEHLENVFYKEAIAKFSAEDFKKVGLGSDFYNNLQQISKDEQTHVEFLTTGLTAAGAKPAQECKYNFGYTDVQSFLATANVLEGVGVSAYLGAAKYIASPDYLTAAGAILTVESRHSAYLRDNQDPQLSPFPSPFDIPLDFDEVFSLAALFITSCPDGTDGTLGLPFKAFPAITAAPAGIAKIGDKLTFTVAKEVEADHAYFITFPGGAIPAEISGSGATYTVTVPEKAQAGQAYVVLTKGSDAPSDDNIVAGPAVFEIADNAYGRVKDATPCSYESSPTPYHSEPAPAPYHSSAPAPYHSAPAPAPYHSAPAPAPYHPAPAPYKPEHMSTSTYESHPTTYPSSTHEAHPTTYPSSTYEAHPTTYPTPTHEVKHPEYPTETPCPTEKKEY